MSERDINNRIEKLMGELWEAAGKEGDRERFREEARLAVAARDTQGTTLLPIEQPEAEPAELISNLGEFPTTTDQGEGAAFPSYDAIPEKS